MVLFRQPGQGQAYAPWDSSHLLQCPLDGNRIGLEKQIAMQRGKVTVYRGGGLPVACQGGYISYPRIHVSGPHSMPDHLVLFSHRSMGLVVFVGSGPKFGRSVAALASFLIEVMGLAAVSTCKRFVVPICSTVHV